MEKRKKHNLFLSKKDKIYYKLFFVIVFAIILFLLLSYNKVVLLLNNFRNYYYVSPTILSTSLYSASLFLGFIDMLFLYNKTYLCKIPLNKLKKNACNIKSSVIFAIIIFLFFVVSLIISVTNVSFINRDGVYKSSETTFNTQDITSVEVSVEESLVSFPKTATYKQYELLCKVSINDKTYYFNSSYFYNYSDLYNYLLLIDEKKIKVLNDKFVDLITYEKEHFNNQSEIDSLGFILKLSENKHQ